MPSNSHASPNPDGEDYERRTADWVLHGADWIVTCDAAMSCLHDGAVAVTGSTIEAVGPTESVRRRFSGIREVDMSGFLLAPGLVNAHVHGAMTCFRGLADDLPLEKWLFEVIFPAEAAHVNPDLVYWGTLLATAEMLKNGTTTFCDGYFFEEAAAEAALQSGMRAVLGQGILDFPTPDQPDPARSRERAHAFLEAFPTANDRLRPSLFCHAPYTCGGETLRWVKKLCRDAGILFQIHLSESWKEVRDIREKHGVPPVEYLDGLGILDELTLCAHGIWVSPEESAILACRGTGIAHDAGSNMKLAAGIAPIPRFLSQGVHVGLGTDSCASNNHLDLFGEMDLAAKVHKVHSQNPEACSAVEVLRMATRGGARVLGPAGQAGSLEVGKKADIMAVDLNAPHLVPLYDPISHLVYSVRGSDVKQVWVDGRQVLSDSRVTTFDEEEARRRVAALARKIKPLSGNPVGSIDKQA
jgi:5-methylthioadenosine/S-adenosylhomocysteine deaminase